MIPSRIKITLKSATTFGRGDGVPGLIDREIEHDEHGFPFLRGKTLKGLLAESAENVVYAAAGEDSKSEWAKAKNALFGQSGRGLEERGILHIGDAQLPPELRRALLDGNWSPEDVFYSLTGIRRQTSINEYGAPEHASLRAMRVLLPGVMLIAPLSFSGAKEPDSSQLQLLAASMLDFRHAGTGRNRGRGWLSAELDDDEVTHSLFEAFGEAIL